MDFYYKYHVAFMITTFIILSIFGSSIYAWYRYEYYKTYSPRKIIPQIIVCAANRVKLENGADAIILGVRHWDSLMNTALDIRLKAFPDELQLWKNNVEQGFIDNKFNFLTRREALVIAKQNHQIIRRCGGDEKKLFSENLY